MLVVEVITLVIAFISLVDIFWLDPILLGVLVSLLVLPTAWIACRMIHKSYGLRVGREVPSGFFAYPRVCFTGIPATLIRNNKGMRYAYGL